MTDLEQKKRLARFRARVDVVLGAVGFLEQYLTDATRAPSLEELLAELVQAEGWAVTVLEDVREVLGEAASYRSERPEEVRT